MAETLNIFSQLLETVNDTKVCVVLDWLAILFMDNNDGIPEADNEEEVRSITDNITLKNFGKGTKDYKTVWHVLYNGEHYATLLSHGRNGKFVKKGLVRVEYKNHLLYSSSLWPFYKELVEALNLKYVNISRVDIAIDGANYLLHWLNAYIKQDASKKIVELKGKKQTFSSNVWERTSMLAQNFKIGNDKKVITIYNKSLDIVNTGKHYIQEYWKHNGIVKELMPLEILAKAMQEIPTEERTYIAGYKNLYRFEMRIRGERIAQIKDFNLSWLKSQDFMISIVKRLSKNFFEFVYFTSSDISKCASLNILPYQKFNIQPIELLPKKEIDDLYKTKLSIKKNVKQLYAGKLHTEDYAVTQMLIFDIKNFELQKWFSDKLTKWHKDFGTTQPNKTLVAQVQLFCWDIQQQVNEELIQDLEDAPF